MRPAIGMFVRVLLGTMGALLLVLAIAVLVEGDRWAPLWLVPLAALFLLPAFLATGPPHDCCDVAAWARRRYRRIFVIRLSAALTGLTGIGLLFLSGRMDSSESWASRIQELCGILIAVALFLEFVQAYYRHYLQETTTRDGEAAVERQGASEID